MAVLPKLERPGALPPAKATACVSRTTDHWRWLVAALSFLALASGVAKGQSTAVFPPPASGATSCSATGASWLTCTISGSTLTLGAASGQTSHRVIGTCGSATSFAPCSLVAGDLPSIPLSTGVTGTLSAANLPGPAGGGPPGAVATIVSPVTINTPQTPVVSYLVPANTIAAGTAYRIVAYGTGTSSVANVNSFKILYNSSAIATLSLTAATSGTNIGFHVEFLITFQSTTVSEVTAMYNEGGNTGLYTSTILVMAPANTTALTTTGNATLELDYASAAATTTATFDTAIIELVKP